MSRLFFRAVAVACVGFAGVQGGQAAVSTLPNGVIAPLNGTYVDFDALPGSNSGILLGSVTLNGIHFSGTGKIFTGTSSGISAEPYQDHSKYLTILAGGKEVLRFDEDRTRLGFYWGSLDTYNSISFYNNHNLVNSFTGAQIDSLTSMTANGGQASFSANRYVNFAFAAHEAFDKVVFKSSGNSFEIDNISAPIPEASTWAMMLAGFLGLAVLHRSRSRRKQADATA